MPWQAQLLPTHPILETCYSGLLTKDELFDAFRATVALKVFQDRPSAIAWLLE